MSLADRARQDAEAMRAADAEYLRTRPPDRGQRIIAAEVGRILGVEVDPRTAVDEGYERPYYRYSVEVGDLRFRGHFLHDTNGLHRTSYGLTVTRTVPGRWFGKRTQIRHDVSRIGDLDGWL